MKWFRHNSDSHGNIKLGAVLHEFGLKGYAIYWLCLELVAEQGSMDYCLNHNRTWELALCTWTGLDLNQLRDILKRFGELDLICGKSLIEGKLYIPKMIDYADTYTLRSSSKVRAKNIRNVYCNVYNTSTNFDLIWNIYLNKVGKKEAFRHFQTSIQSKEDWDKINKAIENYNHSEIVKKDGGKYIMNGKTWFNNWEDWIVPPKVEPDKYLLKEKK